MNFSRSDRGLLVVASKCGSLGGDLFENVVDERVQDAHRLGADTGIRVYLLQDLVDVELRTRTASFVVPMSASRETTTHAMQPLVQQASPHRMSVTDVAFVFRKHGNTAGKAGSGSPLRTRGRVRRLEGSLDTTVRLCRR